MRKLAIAVAVLVALPAAGRAVDTKQLQELLYLPSISLGLGAPVQPGSRFGFRWRQARLLESNRATP
jgi:hypothetical protein